MMSKMRPFMRLRSWALLTVVGVAGVIALAYALLRAASEHAREGVDTHLASLREQGAPVVPEDLLAFVPSGDPSTVAWLREFESLEPTWREEYVDIDTRRGVEAALETCMKAGMDEYVELLRNWLNCLKSEPDAVRLFDYEEMERFLDSQSPPGDISTCERLALHVWFEVSGPYFDHALLAEHHAPMDHRSELQAMIHRRDSGELEILPWIPIPGYIRCVNSLADAAVVAAIDGRFDSSYRLLELAFHAAGLLGEPNWVIGHLASVLGASIAMKGLERALPYFPKDFDLTSVEDQILKWNPHARLRPALEGERTMGNQVFDQMRVRSVSELGIEETNTNEFLRTLLARTVFDVDQALYLDLMKNAIDVCSAKQFDSMEAWEEFVEHRFDEAWFSDVSRCMVPRAADLHSANLEWSVQIQFALAALKAHRLGLASAADFISREFDPFSGFNLFARIEEDHLLVMWSIGSDRVNDSAHGAPEYSWQDIIWRYREH